MKQLTLSILLALTLISGCGSSGVDRNNSGTSPVPCDIFTYPLNYQTVPAGPLRITWNAPTDLSGAVSAYEVWINGNQVGTVSGGTRQYDTYSTTVGSNTVKVITKTSANERRESQLLTYYISKKGNCDGKNVYNTFGACWYYNWSTNPTSGASATVEFVPMVWNGSSANINWLNRQSNPKYPSVLGFNEPDRTDQANMPIDTAIGLWPNFNQSGFRVGSPAVSYLTGNPWLTGFMDQIKAKNYRVDFIAIHSYQGPYVQSFLDQLQNLYNQYHKPIWLTEFAVADWSGNQAYTKQQVYNYMKELLPKLDKLPYIERYAWFPFEPGDPCGGVSALYQSDGSLTDLGQLYRSLGNGK